MGQGAGQYTEPIRGKADAVRVWMGGELVQATCTDCMKLTDAENLVSSKSYKGGKLARCLPCSRLRGQRHYAANKETVKAKSRELYEKNRDYHLARAHAYQRANPERVKARHAAYRELNGDKRRAAVKEYRQLNPEVHKAWRLSPQGKAAAAASAGRRRARIYATDCGCITSGTLQVLWDSTRGLCAYCDSPGEHYDHVDPLALGGAHCVGNLVLACAPCNLSKGAKSLVEFLELKAGTVRHPGGALTGCPNAAAASSRPQP